MAFPVAPVFDRIRLVPRPTDFLDRNTGASGELFYEKETKTLRVYNGLQRGGFEVVSEERLRINTANLEVATVKYLTYVGNDGISNKYFFNTDETAFAPELTFVVGYTYRFDQTHYTNLFYPNQEGGTLNPHPINFSADQNNTVAYTDNVIYLLDDAEVDSNTYYNKFTGATTRAIQITITTQTPTTLYYHCTNHVGMGNVITVGMPGSGSGAGGGASITSSDTAPAEPSAGALWYNSSTGYLYVYVDDGDSQQWVQPVAGNVFSGVYGDLVGIPTFATVASTGDWNDIQNKPTIPATLTDLGISDGSANQVLTTDGAGNFTFQDGGGGGQAYDQTLNTTDDVTFDEITATTSVTAPSVITNGVGVTNFTSSTSLTLSATDGVFLSGIARSSEIVNTLTGATSTVDHSLNSGSVWNHTSIAANFTANFTNVPTTNDRTISVALILNQGATPYIPNAVQINGGAQSIDWEDASAPTGNANQTDVVVFTLVRTGGSWSVLGSLTTYG